MIRLSNGNRFEYVVASGALGLDCRGYLWERPLVALGLVKPEKFVVFTKTLTRHAEKGNLRWSKPWECVRLLPDNSVVNKVDLTNPGIQHWCERIAPTTNFYHQRTGVSIAGTEQELVEMAMMLEGFPNLFAIEVNVSCPSGSLAFDDTETVIRKVMAVANFSIHPVFAKLSCEQECLIIARELRGYAEAISLNTVRWEKVFPGQLSPLARIGKPNSGGGGVSGKRAQEFNWPVVEALSKQGPLPVIGPDIMEYEDLTKLRNEYKAQAFSFGSIHIRTPWKPTQIVERDLVERKATPAR